MSISPTPHTAPAPLTVKMIAVCLLLAVLWWGRPLLAPLCLAGFVALTLNPLVTRLSRAVPRSLAAALVVLSLVGIVGGSAYSLSDEVAEAVEGLPSAARQLRQTLQKSARGGVLTSIDRAIGEVERLLGTPAEQAPAGGTMDLRRTLLAMAGRAGSVMTQGVALVFRRLSICCPTRHPQRKCWRSATPGRTARHEAGPLRPYPDLTGPNRTSRTS